MNALEAVLASEKFVVAPQMSAFLRYVVEQSAQGHRQRIKAYTVAVEALGKPESFDPQNDPVVRVLAGRLRLSLNAFNDSHPDQEVIIRMNPGSYVPEFLVASDEDESETLDATISDDDDEIYMTAANSIISDAEPPVMTRSDKQRIDVIVEERPATSHDAPGNARRSVTTERGNATADRTGSSTGSNSHGAYSNSWRLTVTRRFAARLQRHPMSVLIAGMVMAFLAGLSIATMENADTPSLQAASTSLPVERTVRIARQRPDTLSLFIAQSPSTQPVLGQLYSTISGVLADADNIQLYRILRSTGQERYWPEDYLLSLELVHAEDNTRVNVQLLEAQTGRVSHMKVLELSDQLVKDGLTSSDLRAVAEHAHFLVGENGPLRKDYVAKLDR